MTEEQSQRLLNLLERAIDLAEIHLELRGAVKTAPQSLLEPRTAPPVPEPITEPKRKRGRPRKKFAAVAGIYSPEQIAALNAAQAERIAREQALTPEQKAVRAQMMRDAEIAAFGPPPKEIARDEQAPKTFSCAYCGRVLPHSVRELHEANCRSAAVGYATHVAQPGKQGGGSNLE